MVDDKVDDMVDMVNYVLIKYGGNTLAIECFKDHPGQPLEAPKDQDRRRVRAARQCPPTSWASSTT